MRNLHQANDQRGLTLLELLISISILGGIVAGITSLVQTAGDDARASVTALHTRTVGEAASAYIKDNYASITAVATDTTPALIRVADLVSTGYLPAGYATTNPRLQATCALVLEPTPNQLTGLVITEGGDTIDDLTLGQVASLIGGAGGGIYSTAPTTVRGAMGGYSFDVGAFGNPNTLGQRCDGSAGNIVVSAGHPVMALWYADGAQAASTLYRDAVPGNPALNTMNTPLLLGASTIQTPGAACTSDGALARTATGGVVSCDSGTWKTGGNAYWQDPVATFAGLPACNASALNQTRVVQAPSVGTGRRAYTCNGAGSWEPIGVDNNGNFTVPGTLQLNGVGVAGASCSANGSVARDNDGVVLSCQGGIWRPSGKECPAWGGDLNWLDAVAGATRCVNGAGLGNAPSGDWFFIEVMRHYNTGNWYQSQRAVGMTGGAAGRTWTRSQQSGSPGSGWSGWTEPGGGIGVGQSWVEVSRAANVNYQNTTGRPILVVLNLTGWSNQVFVGPSANVRIAWNNSGGSGPYEQFSVTFVVPDGHFYRFTGNHTGAAELR